MPAMQDGEPSDGPLLLPLREPAREVVTAIERCMSKVQRGGVARGFSRGGVESRGAQNHGRTGSSPHSTPPPLKRWATQPRNIAFAGINSSRDLPPPAVRQAIRRKLLRWYTTHARDLPWRRRRDAYAQWVAEIMLQQTQVATVIPYYERFVRRFPDVASLARAGDDALLRHWQGLGYYRRAENLRRAARLIAADLGKVPDSVDGLMALPGVGRYSAGAIASIAFDRRAPAVDGNVTRVLARLFHITDDVSSPETNRWIWALAESLLPAHRCGDFNQALMELGALVCVPSNPHCQDCPLETNCAARRDGDPASIPRLRTAQGLRELRHVVAMVRREGAFLMVKRPAGGLWSGLWEFPNAAFGQARDRSTQLRSLLSGIGLPARHRTRPAASIIHQLTHRRFRFDVFLINVTRDALHDADSRDVRWLPSTGRRRLPMSTACRKMLRAVGA